MTEENDMFSYLLALNPIEQEMLKIDVASGESTVLVRGLDASPDGIVVDPQREHLYWTMASTPMAFPQVISCYFSETGLEAERRARWLWSWCFNLSCGLLARRRSGHIEVMKPILWLENLVTKRYSV
jgi:hypothetical protein